MPVTMSIHRALAELKTLDKRIQRAAEEKFVAMQIGEEAPKGFKTFDDFNEKAAANYASVVKLIQNRNAIKAAITASNAETKVEIGGVGMSVAEAIDRRDTGIKYEQLLLQALRQQLTRVEMEVERERQQMEPRLDKRIDSDLGSKDRKDNVDEVEKITEAFLKRYKPGMVDPVEIREKIKELTNSIEQFEMEVDFTLSESNTETKITIED